MRGAPRILVLDNAGKYVSDLVERMRGLDAHLEVVESAEASRRGRRYVEAFDGIIASGGHLKQESRREVLEWYGSLLRELDRPFLGICLGLKIMGFCYGARIRRRREALVGSAEVRFYREFPLAPSLRDVMVHQNHSYELVPPLPPALENFASGESPVEAIVARGRPHYAVQFHPEVGRSPAGQIIERFVERCGAPEI